MTLALDIDGDPVNLDQAVVMADGSDAAAFEDGPYLASILLFQGSLSQGQNGTSVPAGTYHYAIATYTDQAGHQLAPVLPAGMTFST